MIITNLESCSRYENMHSHFKPLFDYIKSHDILSMDLGRIELCGDELFINIVELNGVSELSQPLEIHNKYIDVHLLLRGDERIGWLPTELIKEYSQTYDADKDCVLSHDKSLFFVPLTVGDMVIVYPEDAHAPAIGEGQIRKIIAKVKIL